jgi:hypothetical protein
MDYIELPLLRGNHDLEEAIKRMKQTDKRAVVVEMRPGEHRLYMNRDILDACTVGRTSLLDLAETGQPAVALQGPETSYEARLDQAQALFGVQMVLGNWVRIVTRHEGLAQGIRLAKKVCRCSKNRTHMDESPPKHNGDQCDFCDGRYDCI